MLFHTLQFALFLAVVFAVYWRLLGQRVRKLWLLAASCFFYMSWNPWLIGLILLSASVDYVVALRLQQVEHCRRRRWLLVLSIGTNLGLLAFFKYTNFFLSSAYGGLDLFGVHVSARFLEIALPLGISFYTFETISYIVDVYQGKIQPVRNPLDYALYIMFFPHLIAGPIVRPRDFLPQLGTAKRFNWDRLQLGLQFFLIGLFKKAVIADHLATVADAVFASPTAYGSAATWLGVVAYAVQIYCDFSGYSDMAVGVAHLFGYKLPRNFRMPYFAANITEFWRRWHISLSSWLRDYLYIPLGGSRHGRLATYRNLILTMLLGGLWHGANWTFVIWGLYHGTLLALHKLAVNSAAALPAWLGHRIFRPVAVLTTFLSVCIGWVFFRAQSFADAWTILTRMAGPIEGVQTIDPATATIALAFLLVALAGHLIGTLVDLPRIERHLPSPALGAWLAAMFLIALLLMPVDSKGFIYFTF